MVDTIRDILSRRFTPSIQLNRGTKEGRDFRILRYYKLKEREILDMTSCVTILVRIFLRLLNK